MWSKVLIRLAFCKDYSSGGWKLRYQLENCCDTVVLKMTLESPLDCKEIKPVNPKGNQPWIFIGRIKAEVEASILWPPDVKSWLIGKDPDAGKHWRQKKKGASEDEMVRWHHQLNGHEFEQAPEDGDGQGSMVSRVGHDWATELNWNQQSLS